MGFFDSLSNPEIGQGLLGMAAGLLTPGDYGAFGPSLGRGFAGFSQGLQNAQQQAATADYRKMQALALAQNVAQAKQKQALIGNLLGISPQEPTSLATPPQTPTTGLLSSAQTYPVSDVPGGASNVPAASTQPAAPSTGSPLDHLPPEMKQRVMFDLIFNGGKGIADILKPNIQNVRPGGTVYDASTGAVRFSAPTTGGTQVVYGADGQPRIALLPGAEGATSAISAAKARGPASFRTQTVNLPSGENVLTTDAALSDQINNQPAPIRNNNPGALMPGGKLASYPSMEDGLKALDDNLARYGTQGIDTVAGVIGKWAPPNENDTGAYIADVAKRLGIDANQKINLSDPLVRHALGTAIAIHENGVSGVFGSAGVQKKPQMPGIEVQNEGMTAANTALGKGQAQTLLDSRKTALTATDDLTNIAKERDALAGGTFGGSGAQAKLNAVKFLQGWVPGLENLDATKVTNTDYLISTLGKSLLMHAKDLGYNPTDTDASRIEAIVGTIGKDPQALNKIIDYQEMMARRAIRRHNELVAQAQKNGINSAFDLSVSPNTGMPGTTDPDQPSGFKIIGVR